MVRFALAITLYALAGCRPALPQRSSIDAEAAHLHAERFACDEGEVVLRRTDERDVVKTVGCGREATIVCQRSYRHWEVFCGVRDVRDLGSN